MTEPPAPRQTTVQNGAEGCLAVYGRRPRSDTVSIAANQRGEEETLTLLPRPAMAFLPPGGKIEGGMEGDCYEGIGVIIRNIPDRLAKSFRFLRYCQSTNRMRRLPRIGRIEEGALH